MSSSDLSIVLYGSPETIASLCWSFPVRTHFVFERTKLETLVKTDVSASTTSISKYILILLEEIDNGLLHLLECHDRIQVIYSRKTHPNPNKPVRLIHQQFEQFLLDLVEYMSNLLLGESEKQQKLKQFDLAEIQCRQARILREWAMSTVKAQASHILLIPLNTNEKNLMDAQQQLQQLATGLGYPSTVVRLLDDYIPSTKNEKSFLIPYNQFLFEAGSPSSNCDLIRKLSPIRLYLYGNENKVTNIWANEMLRSEKSMFENEESWWAFVEHEAVQDRIKWNWARTHARECQLQNLIPLKISELSHNLRFYAAFRRAQRTFASREIEVTAKIFRWHDDPVNRKLFLLKPQFQRGADENRDDSKDLSKAFAQRYLIGSPLSPIKCRNPSANKACLILLNPNRPSVDTQLKEIISPWNLEFFQDLFQALTFMEYRIHEGYEIFWIISAQQESEAFTHAHRLLPHLRYMYIFCTDQNSNGALIRAHRQIRGVFNDLIELAKAVRIDLEQFKESATIKDDENLNHSFALAKKKISVGMVPDTHVKSVPMLIYKGDEAEAFMAYQHTIDAVIGSPFTSECRTEMLNELRQHYQNDPTALVDLSLFEKNYQPDASLHWYTRDTFVSERINEILRSNDCQLMFKMRPLLADLYTQLDQQYKNTHPTNDLRVGIVGYRGQMMNQEDLDKFRANVGQIISIRTFLSATTSFSTALSFIDRYLASADSISVMVSIETNLSGPPARPYANISELSIHPAEGEVLFAMGSLFRIRSVEQPDAQRNLPTIALELIGGNYLAEHEHPSNES